MSYGVVAIVKNEEDKIEKFIAGAARYANRFTIVDTGSTDETTAKLMSLSAMYPIDMHHRPWVNFGHNRSEAFALARDSADWLLALDADMQVDIDPSFDPEANEYRVDAYNVRVELPGGIYYRLPLLLRGNVEWRSFGAIHEYTAYADGSLPAAADTDLVVIRTVVHRTPEKNQQYLDLLLADHKTRPDDPRTIFYLGQTYRDMGERTTALYWFEKRSKMGGWDQERWYAQYQAALLTVDQGERWRKLSAAYAARPHRLEPLQALIREMNAASHHATVWLLSTPPYPTTEDVAFVQQWVWDWGMEFERSIAAWWTGNISEFLALTNKLLSRSDLPDATREAVKRNLEFLK